MKPHKLYEGEFVFTIDGKEHTLTICHNLPEGNPTMSVVAALNSWLFRTDEYTAENLCDYILSKQEHYDYKIIAFPAPKIRVCKKVCNQCPFREDSAPGWLGGNMNATETADTIRFELPFSCHMMRDDEAQTYEQILDGKYPVCRGWLISANKSYKAFGSNPHYGMQLAYLQEKTVIGPGEAKVIMTTRKFVEHHTRNK